MKTLYAYFTVKWSLLSLIFLMGISVQSQTIYSNYQDGNVYIKIKDEIPFSPRYKNVDRVDVDEFEFIKKQAEEYGIYNIERPFYFSKSPILQRTIKVQFTAIDKVSELIKKLSDNNSIEYAERVPFYTQSFTPNDPSYSQNNQWHLFKINAEQAWDIGTGNSDIIVGVVDGAITTSHNDLSPSLWTNPGEIPNNNIDDDNNGKIDDVNGWDFGDNDNTIGPPSTAGNSWDHGAHVAGIVGATTNNNVGIASIGHGVTVLPVKTGYDCGGGVCLNNTSAGVTYAAENGARVINMSFGGGGFSQTDQNVMTNAWNNGTVMVASAGNNGNTSSNYPAAYSNVVAVVNTDSQDKKNYSSTYGNWVDICAPGTNIYSTSYSNGQFVNKTGTSMASPLVAGLCGLMLSVNPNLTPTEVVNCLKNTAVDIDGLNPSYAGQLGAGRIDAAAALQCVADMMPAVADDAGVNDISISNVNCELSFTPEIEVKNYGSNTITAVDVEYRVDNGPVQTYNWTGNLASNATTTITLPSLTSTVGNHTFTASTNLPNNNQDGENSNDSYNTTFTLSGINDPTTIGDAVCGAGIVNLSASGGSNSLNWYDAPNGGNLVHTGANYSPNVNSTTNYYVEAVGASTTQNFGPADNTIGAGGMFGTNDDHGLVFDVDVPITLKSVYVYADGAGNRTIELLSGVGGTVIESDVISMNNGGQRINLNWNIPAGTDYFIKVTGTVNLYRNSDGAVWPYSINNVVSITGTDITNQGYPYYYYFFYDWEIEEGNGCVSNRALVTAQVDNPFSITAGASPSTVDLADGGQVDFSYSGPNANNYDWDFGDGNTSAQQSPSHTYSAVGNYTVEVTAENGECSATDEILVEVISTIGVSELLVAGLNIKAYPMPIENIITIELPKKWQHGELKIFNIVGKRIKSITIRNENKVQINMHGFSAGQYFVNFESEAINQTFKVVKN